MRRHPPPLRGPRCTILALLICALLISLGTLTSLHSAGYVAPGQPVPSFPDDSSSTASVDFSADEAVPSPRLRRITATNQSFKKPAFTSRHTATWPTNTIRESTVETHTSTRERKIDDDHLRRLECPHGQLKMDANKEHRATPRALLLAPVPKDEPARQAPTFRLRIPRVIFQTHFNRSVPSKMQLLMQTLKDMNPSFAYRYYADDEATRFTKDHCGDRVWRALLRLRAGAFRADIWRYCVLWSHGGVYVDTDFESMVPMDSFLRIEDEFVSVEDNGNGWVFNAFIACTPKHQLAHGLMMEAVRRVELRYHAGNPLSVTGPWMAACVFRQVTGMSPLDFIVAARAGKGGIRLLKMDRPDYCYAGTLRDPTRMGLGPLFYADYLEKHDEMRFYRPELTGAKYHDMFERGDIYWSNRAVRAAMEEATMKRLPAEFHHAPSAANNDAGERRHVDLNSNSTRHLDTGAGRNCPKGLTVSQEAAMWHSVFVNVTIPASADAAGALVPSPSRHPTDGSHRLSNSRTTTATPPNHPLLGAPPRIPRRIIQGHWSPFLQAAEVALMKRVESMHRRVDATGSAAELHLRSQQHSHDFEYYFFNLSGALHFTKLWCPDAAKTEAFLKGRPSTQMDTFRYCFLWTKGGIALDTDLDVRVPLDDILLPTDELVLVEHDSAPSLFSGFIAAAPGNPLIHAALMANHGEEDGVITGRMPSADHRLQMAFGERPSEKERNCAVGLLLPEWKARLLSYVRDRGCALGAIEDVFAAERSAVGLPRDLVVHGYPGRVRLDDDSLVEPLTSGAVGDRGAHDAALRYAVRRPSHSSSRDGGRPGGSKDCSRRRNRRLMME